jgi:hypothetical protein
MGSRGLFRYINKDSRLLLRKVSFGFKCRYNFLLKFHISFVAVSCLTLSILFSPILYVCQPMSISPSELFPHHFHRTRCALEPRSMLGFFKLSKSCRSSCWDRASSLEFENITRSSRPTMMEETGMTSVAFQERIHITTGGGV